MKQWFQRLLCLIERKHRWSKAYVRSEIRYVHCTRCHRERPVKRRLKRDDKTADLFQGMQK